MRWLTALLLCTSSLNAIAVNAIAVNGDEAESESPRRIEIGASVKTFLFTDIRYLPRSLSEFGKREALADVLARRDVRVAETCVGGCLISLATKDVTEWSASRGLCCR